MSRPFSATAAAWIEGGTHNMLAPSGFGFGNNPVPAQYARTSRRMSAPRLLAPREQDQRWLEGPPAGEEAEAA